MNALKTIIIAVLVFNGFYSIKSWLSSDSPQGSYQLQSAPDIQAAEGFDLKALTAVAKEVRGGQELERKLNTEGGINNLDLNGDDKVDYLSVKEFGDPKSGKIGFAITTEPEKGEVQEIAEVTVEENGDRAEIQVVGNEQIYGSQAIYNDWTPIERATQPAQPTAQAGGAYPMYSSFFYPRPLYMSPFGYGYYPPFFSPFSMMAMGMYGSRMSGYRTTTVRQGANSHQRSSNKSIANPDKGKSANKGIKRSLKSPSKSQRAFKTQSNKNVRSGGFGRSKSPGASATRRQLPSSRSTGGFGSSRSRATSTGSFRSSSYGSRSFSFGK
ncbi:MAG: hypothetical protein QNL04_06745 [SAR324 cluster bacterium]|nr:hypothetical protein [SAR324 cluster bacterium]